MAETRAMYMHALDGRPASLGWNRGPHLYFVGGRSPAKLVASLKQLDREQREVRQRWEREYPSSPRHRYGYVRVLVPVAIGGRP